MRTFEFHKPRVVDNVREIVEPELQEYRASYFQAKHAGPEYEAIRANLRNARARLSLTVLQVMATENLMVGTPLISHAHRVGQTFNHGKWWHVDTAKEKRLRMMASSTPPRIASCVISFNEPITQEAECRIPAGNGGDSILTSMFRVVAEKVQNRNNLTWSPSTRTLDWIDIANRGELSNSRYSILEGLVTVEDLEYFVPEDFDVVENEVDTFLHATAPRQAGQPTIRVFGRAYF